jgi:hypothetical protein
MRSFRQTVLAAACAALLALGNAGGETASFDDQAFVPARLPAGLDAALNELALPIYRRGTDLHLYCVTDVSSAGRTRHNACLPYAGFDTTRYHEPIVRMMRKIRLSPARFNGKAVPTELYYRLHFDLVDEIPRVRVYPNWGHDTDRYGTPYEAPQRYETYRFPRDCLFFVGIATTPLDAHGRVTGDPELQTPFPADEATLECIDKIKARLIKGKYIPARRDGEPVAATHAEVWGDPEKYVLDLPGQE